MSGEELYKEIASSKGAGLRELAANPDQYAKAVTENDELRARDLDGFDIANSALSILEDAGTLQLNGGPRSYEVTDEYTDEEVLEAFAMLEEKRQLLF